MYLQIAQRNKERLLEEKKFKEHKKNVHEAYRQISERQQNYLPDILKNAEDLGKKSVDANDSKAKIEEVASMTFTNNSTIDKEIDGSRGEETEIIPTAVKDGILSQQNFHSNRQQLKLGGENTETLQRKPQTTSSPGNRTSKKTKNN